MPLHFATVCGTVSQTHGPLCKTRSGCYEKILIGNAKWELEACRGLRPYIPTRLPRDVSHDSRMRRHHDASDHGDDAFDYRVTTANNITPSLGSDPWWTWMAGTRSFRRRTIDQID
ncbi:uncharacterized protein BDR25DRAFT_309482 [Lindgomyces ingoldianus]|uniref:Uncharacterized protein n=1 Tax=Lindgomyces ingoldianus TaxID=673940 RepID=A0ACB6RDV0_9PLEO|nr:uncharacterized protein BDR25DRAFT_309482 [Lindgomyces ingoldianus]KAF2477210.1 hypothetical protein BDR25DRAFT_309482 [Lindgomyces ingoldianus]